MRPLTAALPFLVLTSLAVACGGETVGQSSSGTGSGSGTSTRTSSSSQTSSTSVSSSGSTTTITSSGTCVDFVVGPGDTTCTTTSDCSTVSTGELCSGACDCGSTPVNNACAARFATETASIDFDACPCANAGQPSCIEGTCVLCGGFNPSPMCHSVINPDASVCVDIQVSSFDTSCTTVSDCIGITAGEICNGNCLCGGSTISASDQAKYDQAISAIMPGECACPITPSPACIGGQCVACGNGSMNPACPDAGF